MKTLKKLAVAALSAAMLCTAALTFAACGDDKSSKEGRLVLWIGEDCVEMFEDIAADYTEETGIPVIVQPYTGISVVDKLALDGPAGRGGDIYMQGGGATLSQAVEQGLFMEVDPAEVELETKFLDGAQDILQYKGNLYGVPLGMETVALIYNKKHVTEIPQTWEELIAFAESFNHFGDDISSRDSKYGLLIDTSNSYYTNCILEAYGGYVFGKNADGTWNPDDLGIANDGAIAAYTMIDDLLQNNILPNEMPLSLMQSKFASGAAAFILDGPWSVPTYRNAGIDVGVVRVPDIQISENETGTPVTFADGYGLCISSYTKNPEQSVDFLKFVSQEKYVMEYYRTTGRIPSLVECEDNEELLADETIDGFYAQLEHSHPQPNINELNAVWEPLQAAATSIFINGEPVADTLKSVEKIIKDNMALLG